MPEMKTLQGYEIVDAQARKDIEDIQRAGYATEAYVDNAIENIPEVDLSKHALKSELPTKISQLENDSKYITREEVPETDLSEYAKKSEIPDVSDFITNIPSEYITESELSAKGYLTEHQSLAGYATENYVDDAIASIEIPEVIPTDGIKAVFIDASSLGASSSAIPEEYISVFQKYASGEDRDVYFFIKLDEKTYYQPESIYMPSDTMLSIDLPVMYHTVNNPGQLYKKSLTIRLDYNPASWWINTSYNNLATKKYVDDAIANIDIPEVVDVDLSNYYTKDETYTKEEVNELIPESAKIVIIDKSGTQESIEAILEAGNWPVFRMSTNEYILPLVRRIKASSGAYTYYFGGTYNTTTYYIKYKDGWDTIVSSTTLVEKDVDVQANAYGDPDSVLKQIKISNKIYSIPSGSGEWKRTDGGQWSEDLHNAKEIYVRLRNTNNNVYYSSCTVFPGEILDQHFNEKFATNAFDSDGTPVCWYYDGTSFQLDGNSNGTYVLEYVAYKA